MIELPRVGSRIVDSEIARLRASGREVLPVTAYPDRPLPDTVLEVIQKAARKMEHAPSQGLLELREAIGARLTRELAVSVESGEIVVTSGAMDALNIVFNALLDPGDEVLIFSPCFFFEGLIRLARGKVKYIGLDERNRYALDMEKLQDSISPRSKALLLTTPNNPTGHVASDEELKAIAEMAQRWDLWVVVDESYDRLIYDGNRHRSILSVPGMKERTVLIRSFTKSFCMADWRVGYLVCPLAIVESCVEVLEWRVLYNNSLSQKVAATVLQMSDGWLSDVAAEFEHSRDLMLEGIEKSEQLHAVKPDGGPFLFVNMEKLNLPCEVFSQRLLYEFGIPTTPGCWHQECHHFRLAFGGARETQFQVVQRLEEAAARQAQGGGKQ